MRTGAAAGHRGYYHEAICYDSDDHLLSVVVPFLLGGVAAGEPTLVSFGPGNAALVRSVLPDESGVSFLPGDGVYARPAVAIRSYRQMLASYVADGAKQIRIVGELPVRTLHATWDWWARYESTINHAYDDFPLWSMCAYDVRATPDTVLRDVVRTHPRIAMPDGNHVASLPYTDPMSYLREDRPAVVDPIQLRRPRIELTDPTPAQARQAVHDADPGHLPFDDVQDLVMAVSETVGNALRHGRPPVRFRLWVGEDRIVAEVRDGGDGPKDPYVGLLPAGNGSVGGLGLWITYQSCNHVTMHRGPDDFTLRLTAGNPYVTG